MRKIHTYAKTEVTDWRVPNLWDVVALLFVIGIVVLLSWGASHMFGHYQVGQQAAISLNPSHLPYYALRTFLRMIIAMVFSLLFTFVFATMAAKSKQAERIIIPFIDVMQSVPVLGFLSIIVVSFITLFKGSMLGPEFAAVFAIFTAQVWNMALSFYQSLRTLPKEMHEAAKMFHLSAWQKFWRMEVPFAVPGLLWNMMMSMSSSWVFLVVSEAISIGHYQIHLPGIGSYIALAITERSLHGILYAIIAMVVVIALYDQILFRPLVAWSHKFNTQETASEIEPESWVINLFQRTRLLRTTKQFFVWIGDAVVNFRLFRHHGARKVWVPAQQTRRTMQLLSNVLIAAILIWICFFIVSYLSKSLHWFDVRHAAYFGVLTALRVLIVIVICSIVWVPIGVMIGLSPRASQIVQPVVQFLAAFPANLLFPFAVMLILKYHLSVNIWTSPLMILGTQWYILFNVIAGTMALPKNMHQAVGTLNVRGWLWWKRFILPGIFPYYITGAITAAGGAWNYSIIAEAISWGHTTLYAQGLGAYITKAYTVANFPKLALGIVVMAVFVLVINRVLWRPLYRLAEKRFNIK